MALIPLNPYFQGVTSLHAAHAVDAVFGGQSFDKVVQIVLRRLFYKPFDDYGPRSCLEAAGVARGVAFVDAEFIVVVVGRGVGIRRYRLGCVVRTWSAG